MKSAPGASTMPLAASAWAGMREIKRTGRCFSRPRVIGARWPGWRMLDDSARRRTLDPLPRTSGARQSK